MSKPFIARATALLRSRRLHRLVLWAAGLVAAYAALGFLVLPPVARSLIEKKGGEALHRQVAVERVAFNPFTFEADIAGFSARAEGGREVAGFDLLHADLQAASLFHGGPVLRELRLEGPRLNVIREKAGRYDISDLIEEWSKPSEPPSQPPAFSVSNIQVSGGKATLIDKAKGVTHTVDELTLRLPFVSSLPYQADIFIEPHFSARINGAPLVLEGRTKPFAETHESELKLDLDKVELARYQSYAPTPLPFDVRGGSLDSELKVVFRQDAHGPRLHLVGAFHLKDLRLTEKDGAPLLAWKKLDVTLQESDLLRRHFAIDKVHVDGLDGHARMSPEGKLNWLELAERLSPPAGGESQAKAAPPTWSVKGIRLTDGALRYQDLGRPQSAVQVVDRIEAKVEGLSSDSGKKLRVEVVGRIDEGGSLKVGGEVQPQPLAANLDVDVTGLPLLPFQPYFADRVNLVLTGGQLSAQGSVDLQSGEKGLEGGFKGQLTLGDVQSVDKASNADFLKWKSLFFDKVDARLQPFSLSIGEVALSDFYARMVVTPQGRLNLSQIVRRPEAPPAPPAVAKTTEGTRTEAVVPPTPSREVFPISIGKVSLQGGTINFSDYFVKPNYTVNVTKIAGRINGLSSAPDTVADLELRGSYGSSAPVQVLAKLNPLAAKTYLDLKGEIRGVDLTTLSTYAAKYAGYAIDQGKLSLFVTYRLDHNQLTADNRVFLDQLVFGEKVDSPTATTLPVKLAVALLKNRRGEIDINLPVSGSIDDPQFSLGGVIGRVIGNVLVKAVTSPFALLGSVFGGGEELSTLDFEPGRVTLSPTATKRLEALAKAMNDRPALKLEITGTADPETDREGLKRVALEHAVKAQKQKELVARTGGAPDLEDIEIDPKEYPTYLQRAYREAKFPKPRNLIGFQKDLPVEEMEKLMLANLPVGEKELHELADRRAEAAESWLEEQGKVPSERIFIGTPKFAGQDRDSKASPSRVDFALH